jgi:hypothetical protein
VGTEYYFLSPFLSVLSFLSTLLDSDNLLEAINKFYFEDKIPTPHKKEDLDLASQITINSEIASTKFAFFRIALWLLILAILAVLILGSLSLVIHRKL